SNELKELIISTITKAMPVEFIILFGSYANGTAQLDSDIDIAYISNEKISSYDRFLLSGELALATGVEVDLVDLKQIDTVFTLQIFSEGIPIFIHNENEFMLQKMRAYSMYVSLTQ